MKTTQISQTTDLPTVAFHTLGCKLNQAETDAMATHVADRGFRVISNEQLRDNTKPDYIVINTCTVTAKADRKTRHSIYKALRLAGLHQNDKEESKDEKKSVVIVTGCFVGNDAGELDRFPIQYVINNSKKKHIPDIIDAHYHKQAIDPNELPEDFFSTKTRKSFFRTRDNLKIQDGCDNFCTFCIIPTVRGTAKSKPLMDIVQDARMLIECGTKEIVLTGVNMSRYAYENKTFSDVLESILKLSGNFRIRISSLEPDTLDEKFLDLLSHSKMCPHLHLCLQSGSERILLMMRRMYTKKSFVSYTEAIKKRNTLFNFTTDIIVGFPEENESDFKETLKTVEEVGFSHVHAFPYSARVGTRAFRMEDISQKVKKERIEKLRALSTKQKNAYRKKLLNIAHQALIETTTTNTANFSSAMGTSEYYCPIALHATENTASNSEIPSIHNSIVPVIPTSYTIEESGEIVLRAQL